MKDPRGAPMEAESALLEPTSGAAARRLFAELADLGEESGTLALPMSRLSLLVDLASLIPREVDLDSLLQAACERLAEAMHADRATLWLVDAERGDLFTQVAVLPELPALRQPMGRGIAGFVAEKGEVLRVDDAHSDPRFDPSADAATGYTTRNMLVAPVREGPTAPVRGVVQVLNRAEGSFSEEDERFLAALAIQLGHVLSLTTLRAEDASGPGVVMRGPFNHIVGRSPAMDEVYERVALSAQTDASVLLRGETGTGKSLLARAVHVNGARQGGPFVTVDCTTLPGDLVESELFGHERGSFTGAERRVRGKVEMAEGGTLFLDEIGDLPLEIQGKLLRFLQEKQFERVGGRETLHSDTRILCATHRDLEAAVEEGTFREDLYYRVRVVEIEVPPLRARGPDEVERLARHFLDLYARRHKRLGSAGEVPELSADVLSRLRAHDWPGNVRELEHWIESAVVLAPQGKILLRHLPTPRGRARRSAGVTIPLGATMEEAKRAFVEAVVASCGGSRKDAAEKLGIGRNTVTRLLKD